jgi:probable O-glycosylation ligase (exosortase A-associated)
MRDFALTIVLLVMVPLIFYRPHVGVLAWAWMAFMNPHREVYSFLQGASINLAIAVLTITALIFSHEKWRPRFTPTLVVMLVFASWTTLTTYTALDKDVAVAAWVLNIKTFFLAVLVCTLIDRPARIHSLVLIIVISVGYWGVVSAIQTFASGGYAKITGPEGSMITDNNQLALALVMTIPLVEYCRHVSENNWLRVAATGTLILMLVTILGTYSRGGLVALGAISIIFWWRSRNRLLTAGILAIPVAVALVMLPAAWSDRMATLETFQSDRSFESRVTAWKTALRIGLDRPLVGAGYRATEDVSIYSRYNPGREIKHGRAIHDAYLQVLADHGFVGLALFVLMFFLAFRDCRFVATQCLLSAELYWLRYLAQMLEIGFYGYAVGAIALSTAYYDVFLTLVVLSSLLRDYVLRERRALVATSSNRSDGEPRFVMAALPSRPHTR